MLHLRDALPSAGAGVVALHRRQRLLAAPAPAHVQQAEELRGPRRRPAPQQRAHVLPAFPRRVVGLDMVQRLAAVVSAADVHPVEQHGGRCGRPGLPHGWQRIPDAGDGVEPLTGVERLRIVVAAEDVDHCEAFIVFKDGRLSDLRVSGRRIARGLRRRGAERQRKLRCLGSALAQREHLLRPREVRDPRREHLAARDVCEAHPACLGAGAALGLETQAVDMRREALLFQDAKILEVIQEHCILILEGLDA
mmetsp:Transcript_122758/g.358314  ORF Transcript_122758/g.358314 Transcript_122758/m.358314 type:complete len:251 (+) Transcript_122758:521-1273(+)